ncbi:hypothetical protein I8752_28685 [Nostocaceae cyanobacterium CENA369]|uniref:Uncharacterized protein n=1 Tax=Dendronalium phyllosphericum CENA369 TaxID=1725256 RepID=A0A8J7LM48_9NOST|nr:hypothetical protein [Dendronalium phyllosphericum]MBH8576894.1 hypothetical protein [Dendronalium phyllosphericum CENA369]
MTCQQLHSLPKAAQLFASSALNIALSASVVFYSSTSQAENNGAIPEVLQGEWLYGRISSIQYQDQYTGQSAAPNGSSDRFQVTANSETYDWSVETNEYGQQVLVLDTLDGKGRAHYGRPQ